MKTNTKTALALLYFCFQLSAFCFSAAAAPAPISLSYSNDIGMADGTNWITVDQTLVQAIQPAHRGLILQYSEDLVTWNLMAYWSPYTVEQQVWIAWYAHPSQRQHHLNFRAIATEEDLVFLLPLLPPPGSFSITRGTRKLPKTVSGSVSKPVSEMKTAASHSPAHSLTHSR